jgi:hypothetical protein
LQRCLPEWQLLCSNQWINRVIETGYRLPFAEAKPPLRSFPPFTPPCVDKVKEDVIDKEVHSLLAKNAVVVVTVLTPGFYGRIFVVPKRSGCFRPVLDLSLLNLFLISIKFRMDTPVSFRESIREVDWAASVDLIDSYFHLLFHRAVFH